jgi:hypothetical protein
MMPLKTCFHDVTASSETLSPASITPNSAKKKKNKLFEQLRSKIKSIELKCFF